MHRKIVPKLVLNENRIPIVHSQMRLGLKIQCCAVYSGTGCVKCDRGCTPKSMAALVFRFYCVLFTEKTNKKRKFVDILEQSLSQTRLCAIFKFETGLQLIRYCG